MKIKFKKFIAIFASAAMLCTSAAVLPEGMSFDFGTSITAGAAGTEQQETDEASVAIDGEKLFYATLEEAFAAANGKTATITMLTDAECTYTDSKNPSPLPISKGNVTLDMNGKTLTGKSYGNHGIVDVSGGSLLVQGEGKVMVTNRGLFCNVNGKLTAKDITLELVNGEFYAISGVQNNGGTVILNGVKMTGAASDGQIYQYSGNTTINNVTATGTTESVPNSVWYYNEGTLKINGGTFDKITVDSDNCGGVQSVAELLGNGCTYRKQDGAWATDDEMAAMEISNVTVEKIPLTIKPEAETSWYYNSGEHSLQMNATPVKADAVITYEWYAGDTKLDCTADAYPIPKTMSAGNYTYTCKAICDGYALSHEFKFEVKLCSHTGIDYKPIAGGKHGGTCTICGNEVSEEHNITLAANEKLPTCTENGNIAYWYCDECNAYFSDENCTTEITLSDTVITANGHNYVDGKCSICGGFEDGIGRLSGASLSLSGNIGVNFFIALSSGTVNDENAYMQFTLPNGDKTQVKVSDAEIKQENENTYYVFSCEVNAKEMNDTITAQMITSDGKGTVYEYSVKEYVDSVSENPGGFNDKTLKLVNAMASYGDYAKAYFGGGSLAATEEMDSITADTLAGYEKQSGGELPEGITYYGSSLLLESNTTIRHYFKAADGTDVSAYGFIEKDGYYYKEITDISADKLGMAQNVTVGGFTISYSPLSYAYTVLKSDSTDESLKNLVKALYLYEQAAEAYKMTEVI